MKNPWRCAHFVMFWNKSDEASQATTLYSLFLKLESFTKFSMLYFHPHLSMPYSHWQLHAHILCSWSFLLFIVRKTLLTFHTHEPFTFYKTRMNPQPTLWSLHLLSLYIMHWYLQKVHKKWKARIACIRACALPP